MHSTQYQEHEVKAIMNDNLVKYLDLLRRPIPEPSLEPDLDDIDEKADAQMQ